MFIGAFAKIWSDLKKKIEFGLTGATFSATFTFFAPEEGNFNVSAPKSVVKSGGSLSLNGLPLGNAMATCTSLGFSCLLYCVVSPPKEKLPLSFVSLSSL